MLSFSIFSQSRQDYYVVVKASYSIEPIQAIENLDQTLTLQFADNTLNNFYNSKPIYFFEKEFTSSNSPYLQRVYKVTLDNDTHLADFFNREEIEYV